MILQALAAYAEREGLGSDEEKYFAPVSVSWQVSISLSGEMYGLPIPLAQDPTAKKRQPRRLLRPFRSPNELNQGNQSYFLCDTLERTTQYAVEEQKRKTVATQNQYFKDLLHKAAEACPSEAAKLRALLQFLNSPPQLAALHATLAEANAKPNENVAFLVNGEDLLENPALKSFWRNCRDLQAAGADLPLRPCLVTGRLAPILSTHEAVKGLPGSLPQGAVLISFDKAAFQSYGLKQAQNAPVSVPAELRVRSALTSLIQKSRAQGLIFGDNIVLHWMRDAMPDTADPLDVLANPNPEAVARLLQSVQTGRRGIGFDAGAYYAATLSGSGPRIVLRDWIESAVGDVKAHVAQWFADIAIVEPGGGTVKREFSIWALLHTLANDRLEKPLDALPHGSVEQMLRAALTGAGLPRPLLAAALRREVVDRVAGGPKPSERKPFQPARFALLKLCLNRLNRGKDIEEMPEKLNPESHDVAYLCGQLFAVLGRLQLLALGRVGASIAERTYAGVASRPATTLGPVFSKVPAYLKKANDRFPGSGTNKQKEIEQVCTRIEAHGGLPRTLALEEQARFALAYYCQLADYRARTEEARLEREAEQIEDIDDQGA